jgi:tRNA(His) 5'-end guanylyltransferase
MGLELREGNVFKEKEREIDTSLDSEKYTIMRLNGKNFHSYTHGMIKPYDPYIIVSMFLATKYLLKRIFNDLYIVFYIQSDEVSIVMKPIIYPFKGRIQKILTLSSASMSASFGRIMDMFFGGGMEKINEIFLSLLETKEIKKPKTLPIFDARLIQVDSEKEVNDYLTWRRIDAIRNSKNLFAQSFYSTKQLSGVTSDEAILRVEKEFGVNWREFPSILKRGIIQFKDSTFISEFAEDDEKSIKALDILNSINIEEFICK